MRLFCPRFVTLEHMRIRDSKGKESCKFCYELKDQGRQCLPISESTNLIRPYPINTPEMMLYLQAKNRSGNYCLEACGVLKEELQNWDGLFATAELEVDILYCPFCGKKL